MSQKAPWLALFALILIATAVFVMLRTESAGPPETGAQVEEPGIPQAGQPMVAEGGVETPVAGTQTPPERRQIDTPPPAVANLVAVRGRLVGADGNPVAGRPVELGTDRLVPGGQLEGTTSDAEGRFSYRVGIGRGGFVRLADEDWVLNKGLVRFQGSSTDIDLGDLEVASASVVAGTVLDPAGQPVPGVQVRAGQGRIMALDDVSRRLSATTDAEGRFRIGGLHAGEYDLRTASPAFLPRVEDIALRVGEHREDVVLQLQRGQAIAGQVVDDLGRPIAGINVGSRRRSSPAAGVTMERFTPGEATVTDDNGLFTLAGLEGDHATVRAWGEGYDEAIETEVAIGTSNLVLQVQRLAVIVGTLVDDTGAPIAGSRVRASRSRSANNLAMETLALASPEGRVSGSGMATTQQDGSFRIEGVSPGSLTVRATGDGHRPAERDGIAVAPGDLVQGVHLIATRGATLLVEVVDSDGEPVPEADVVVMAIPERSENASGGGPRRVVSQDVRIEERGGERVVIGGGADVIVGRGRTDSEGMATIGGLRGGTFLVKASHTELVTGQPRPVSLPESGTVEARLAMAPGGFADLAVVDAVGESIPDARYIVRGPSSALQPDEHPGRTDGVGSARVGPLIPGSYSAILQLQAPGRSMGPGIFVSMGDNRPLEESRVDFEVRAGEATSVELTKPVLTIFTGTVFDASGPVSGASVQLRRKTGNPGRQPGLPMGGTFQATTEADGSFAIEDLSAGTYTVTYGRPTQLVKAETEVDFAAGQPEARQDLRLSGGTLRITVMSQDHGGPLAGAEVEVVRPGAEEGRQVNYMMMAVRTEPGGGGETMTMEMGGSSVVTDDEGVAVIEAVPPGDYSLRINHPTHVEQVVTGQRVSDGAVTDAGVAALALGGTVSGRITSDLTNVMLALVEYRLAEGGEPDHVTSRDGKYRLEGLKPGKYLLRARDLLLTDAGRTRRWSTEREVEVKPGQVTTMDLALPTSH